MPKHAKPGLPSIIRRRVDVPMTVYVARLNSYFGEGPVMRDRRSMQLLRDSQTTKH